MASSSNSASTRNSDEELLFNQWTDEAHLDENNVTLEDTWRAIISRPVTPPRDLDFESAVRLVDMLPAEDSPGRYLASPVRASLTSQYEARVQAFRHELATTLFGSPTAEEDTREEPYLGNPAYEVSPSTTRSGTPVEEEEVSNDENEECRSAENNENNASNEEDQNELDEEDVNVDIDLDENENDYHEEDHGDEEEEDTTNVPPPNIQNHGTNTGANTQTLYIQPGFRAESGVVDAWASETTPFDEVKRRLFDFVLSQGNAVGRQLFDHDESDQAFIKVTHGVGRFEMSQEFRCRASVNVGTDGWVVVDCREVCKGRDAYLRHIKESHLGMVRGHLNFLTWARDGLAKLNTIAAAQVQAPSAPGQTRRGTNRARNEARRQRGPSSQ